MSHLRSTENDRPPGVSEAALVRDWLRTWRPGFVIATPEDEWTFEEMVVNAARVRVCQSQLDAMAALDVRRAETAWDLDRLAEAQEVAAGLSKRPALTVRRLECSRAGCAWLAGRWQDIEAATAIAGGWTDAAKTLAMDLLGIPGEFRDAEPPAFQAGPGTLARRERGRLLDLLREVFEPLDRAEREAALHGLPVRPNPERDRLRRHEAACYRRYERARKRLQARDGSAPAVDPWTQTPGESAPEPEPVAERRRVLDDASMDLLDVPDLSDEEYRAIDRELLRQIAEKYSKPEASEPAPALPAPARSAVDAPGLNRRSRRARRAVQRQVGPRSSRPDRA